MQSVAGKYFSTSHSKDAVDNMCGQANSIEIDACKSKWRDTPIIQSAIDFAAAVKTGWPQ